MTVSADNAGRSVGYRRVVVTGLGALTGLGNDLDSNWDGLISGRSGVSPITAFEQDDRWATRIAGEIHDWDATDLIPKVEHKKMDRVALIGLHAALQAANDSGFDFNSGDPYRHGVVFGTGIGGIIAKARQCTKPSHDDTTIPDGTPGVVGGNSHDVCSSSAYRLEGGFTGSTTSGVSGRRDLEDI